jgi:hypothetical protein
VHDVAVSITPEHDTPAEIDVPAELLADLDDPIGAVYAADVSRLFLTTAGGIHGVCERLTAGEHRLRLPGGVELGVYLSGDRLFQAMRTPLSQIVQQSYLEDAGIIMARTESAVRYGFAATVRVAAEAILGGGTPHPPSAGLMEAARQAVNLRAALRVIAAGTGVE